MRASTHELSPMKTVVHHACVVAMLIIKVKRWKKAFALDSLRIGLSTLCF